MYFIFRLFCYLWQVDIRRGELRTIPHAVFDPLGMLYPEVSSDLPTAAPGVGLATEDNLAPCIHSHVVVGLK